MKNIKHFKTIVLLSTLGIMGVIGNSITNHNLSEKITNYSNIEQHKIPEHFFYENIGFLKTISSISNSQIENDIKNLQYKNLGTPSYFEQVAIFITDLEFSITEKISNSIKNDTLEKTLNYLQKQKNFGEIINSTSIYDADSNSLIINTKNFKQNQYLNKEIDSFDNDATIYSYFFNQSISDLFLKKYNPLDKLEKEIKSYYTKFPSINTNTADNLKIKQELKKTEKEAISRIKTKYEEAYKDIFSLLLLQLKDPSEYSKYISEIIILNKYDSYDTETKTYFKNYLSSKMSDSMTEYNLNLIDISEVSQKFAKYIALEELNSELSKINQKALGNSELASIYKPQIYPLSAFENTKNKIKLN